SRETMTASLTRPTISPRGSNTGAETSRATKTLFGGPLMVSDYVLNRCFRAGRTELNRDHTRPVLCRHASYSSRGPCSFTYSSIRLLRVVTRQMQPQSNTGVIHAHTPNPSPHSCRRSRRLRCPFALRSAALPHGGRGAAAG